MAINVKLLEDDDVIQSGDWGRQLSLTFTGQSDYLATISTYGGSRINRLRWMLAKEICPAWIGKTVAEFNKAMNPDYRHAVENSMYEFVRGEIPRRHQE